VYSHFGDGVERLVSESAVVASEADNVPVRPFVREIRTQHASRRGRLVIFATTFAVMVSGVLASFGGVAYAASDTSQAATAAKHAIRQKTSAQGQYDNAKPVQPVTKVKGAAVATTATQGTSTKPVASSTLPFTGLSLVGIFVLGIAIAGVGLALRRRESGGDSGE
jgi:hypothetical protein